MSEEESLPPQVEYWLLPDIKHDCYFIVGCESGPTERIGAFKAFLIGYSEPLRAMLQDSELAEQGDVPIVDIEPDTFRVFLKCLYMGLTDTIIKSLPFQECCDLLYVAEKYLVTQLKEKLIKRCLETLSSEINCINVSCSNFMFMQELCLKMALINIFQNQIKGIISSAQFFQITDDSLLCILELDPLDIDEMSLWKAVLNWAKNKTNSNDGNVIRQCTLKLLKHLRFCSMNVQDFCEHVVPTDVLTGNEVNQICKYYGTKEIPNMEFICNVVTGRYGVVDLNVGPKDVTFNCRVENLLSLSNCKSEKFQFQNFMWHLLIQKRQQEFDLVLVREGSMHDPSWKYRVKATLTLVNCQQHNSSILPSPYQLHNYPHSFVSTLFRNNSNEQEIFLRLKTPYHTYYSEEPSNGFTNFLLFSAVFLRSGQLTDRDSATVSVTVSS